MSKKLVHKKLGYDEHKIEKHSGLKIRCEYNYTNESRHETGWGVAVPRPIKINEFLEKSARNNISKIIPQNNWFMPNFTEVKI